MKISVTAEDIEKGTRGSCYNCPVALALRRETGKEWGVDCDLLSCPGDGVVLPMPEAVGYFVDCFDRRRAAEPFDFDLPIEDVA